MAAPRAARMASPRTGITQRLDREGSPAATLSVSWASALAVSGPGGGGTDRGTPSSTVSRLLASDARTPPATPPPPALPGPGPLRDHRLGVVGSLLRLLGEHAHHERLDLRRNPRLRR